MDRIADRIEIPDKLLGTDAEAEPGARERPGLGEGPRDEQVVVLRYESHAALRAEIHIRLVDDDHVVRIGADDGIYLTGRERHAGRGVRVGDHDILPQSGIILRINGKILTERYDMRRDMHEVGVHGVESVTDIRKGDGPRPVAEGEEGEIEDLVGTVHRHDVLRLHPPQPGRRFAQRRTGRIVVQVQAPGSSGRRGLYERRGRERRLVGIELRILLIPRLLARSVRRERGMAGT